LPFTEAVPAIVHEHEFAITSLFTAPVTVVPGSEQQSTCAVAEAAAVASANESREPEIFV
jgi:hypothetical protein